MEWLKDIFDFLEENTNIISKDTFRFIIWTILCIGLSLKISSWNNNRLKDRIASLKEENAELKAEKDALFIKYSALEEKYRSMDLKTRLLQGADEFPSTTAKIMSKNVMNRDWSKK